MSNTEPGATGQAFNLLDNIYVVGIGASAGGLEAITEFFDNVPSSTDCAFVIIQHLSPDYKSLMPELLLKHTSLPICVGEDNMFVRPGHIYLIPHKKNMTISYGKLRLKDKDLQSAPNMTIDIFFNSLAEYKKDKAIAVVLSGTGTDGARGLSMVKENGGLTIVQDPLTAKFDGMPNSAIISGYADHILSPEIMFEEILHHIQQTPSQRTTIEELADGEDQVLKEVLELVKLKTGNDFSMYKRPTLIRRILRRIGFKNFKTLSEYRQYLYENEGEVFELSNEFLIGVTRFFRDEEAFESLERTVIPDIIERKRNNEPLKVWVAGCSTGEEAYSIAILIQETLTAANRTLEVKIFATDLDKNAIDKASKGVYPGKIIDEVSAPRLNKFFEKSANEYKIIPAIRKMIIFSPHDLIKDPPFSKIDLVVCRNLLIYFDRELQKRAFLKFHFSLNLNGYMFLGPSENLGEISDHFEEVSKKWRIYKNVIESKGPVLDTFSIARNIRTKADKDPLSPKSGYTSEFVMNGLMQLTEYSVIFVNEQLEVMHAVGDFKKFIAFPEKILDFNILKMVPNDLSVLLGAALRRAFKNNDWVIFNGNKVEEKSQRRTIDIAIQPSYDRKRGKVAAIYLKERSTEEKTEEAPQDSEPESKELSLLKHELVETKENLQSAIEELETANEEMQSANEELTSANEELQSTNEELQSLNEELHTVNAEHQQKIKELLELNDDLNNYFTSTDIGQVFVDSNLVIRKFTPAIKQQINLIENDIGRPIAHISNNIRYNRLMDDLHTVSSEGVSLDREIQTTDGRWFLMKLVPYIRYDKKIGGVVLAFIDIDKLKMLNDHLGGILTSSLNGIMTFTCVRNADGKIADFEWTLFNPSAEKILRKKASALLGTTLLKEMPEHKENGLFDKYVKVVESGEPLHLEHYYEHQGLRLWLEIAAVKLEDGLAITFADISEKKSSQENIRKAFDELKITKENLQRLNNELELRVTERTRELSISEERFRLLSLATNDAIWDWDLAGKKLWVNEGFRKIFGYQDGWTESGIESIIEKIHPEDRERVVEGIQSVIRDGQQLWSGEYRLLKYDGSYAFILDRAYVLRHQEDNLPFRMIGSMVDLTNVKKAQTQLELTNENLKKINTDLDNFIYTASHDLKAPISNIEGLMYTLSEIIDESGLVQNDEVKEVLGLINKSVNRFKETIKDLTTIAKVQKENVEDLESINLLDIIEDIRFSIKDMFIKSNATIHYDLQEPMVIFSKKNIRSILYNLINNAIKYRSPDRDPVITIHSEKTDGYIKVSVQDNGLGIPKEKQNKVFGMFKRLHDHVDGTGIGLYIVKRVMENAGGKVEMESEQGEGSSFNLYFKQPVLSQDKPDSVSSVAEDHR